MNVRGATRGFVLFLLTVPVTRGQAGWGVTYLKPHTVCAIKGSTVQIRCDYRFPDAGYYNVMASFWFTKSEANRPVDLRQDSEYRGRVGYRCDRQRCTLTITDLRDTDSAEYNFRFITNKPGGEYSGHRGVTLTVTELRLEFRYDYFSRMLVCDPTPCMPTGASTYIYYINGQDTTTTSRYGDTSAACAVKGYETSYSPLKCVRGSCSKVSYAERKMCALKGSSVNISCTYNTPKVSTVWQRHAPKLSTFWFVPGLDYEHRRQPEDLKTVSGYVGRVQYHETQAHSTLTINTLRESDSAEYRFMFTSDSFKWGSSLPGTILTVTGLRVTMTPSTVIEGRKVTLTCETDCFLTDNPTYIWHHNGQVLPHTERQQNYMVLDPVSSQHAGQYSCAVRGGPEDLRAPEETLVVRYLRVTRTPSTVIGQKVTLTCETNCDLIANPTYIWHHNGQVLTHTVRQHNYMVLDPVSSQHAGQYSCALRGPEDLIGPGPTETLNVRYGPKKVSLSVRPSRVIREGSPVTLTCESDANPEDSYTWYKNTATTLHHFPSISSKDSGAYHCQSSNQYGKLNSSLIFIDVQYAPKNASVSASPSAVLEQGSSVTLTCSSVANPPVKYTWYHQNEDTPKATGQNFTITSVQPDHRGYYYCIVQNKIGGRNSTFHLEVVAVPWIKTAAGAGIPLVALLVIIAIFVFRWVRRKRASRQPPAIVPRSVPPKTTVQNDSDSDSDFEIFLPLASSRTSAAHGEPMEQRDDVSDDDVNYSSVHFTKNQAETYFPRVQPPQPHEGQNDVHYSGVHFNRSKNHKAHLQHPSAQPPPRPQKQKDQDVNYCVVKF